MKSVAVSHNDIGSAVLTGGPGFSHCFCHYPVMSLWTSHLTSAGVISLIWEFLWMLREPNYIILFLKIILLLIFFFFFFWIKSSLSMSLK